MILGYRTTIYQQNPGNDQEKLFSINQDSELTLIVYSYRMIIRDVARTPGIQ